MNNQHPPLLADVDVYVLGERAKFCSEKHALTLMAGIGTHKKEKNNNINSSPCPHITYKTIYSFTKLTPTAANESW